MSDFHDDDLSELERRMRAKLFPTGSEPVRKPRQFEGGSTQAASKPTQVASFSEEEKRIASRFLGSANAERIANAREGRRVRLAPVQVTYEWYWFCRSERFQADNWFWRINRVENGHKREEVSTGTCLETLGEHIDELRAKGIRVVDVNHELEGPSSRKTVAKRKSFAERFGGGGR